LNLAHNEFLSVSPKIRKTSHEFSCYKFGFFGVQLFFMISGFVILMSLEKTEGFFHFIYKRWIRLFPALLIASLWYILLQVFPDLLLPIIPIGILCLISLFIVKIAEPVLRDFIQNRIRLITVGKKKKSDIGYFIKGTIQVQSEVKKSNLLLLVIITTACKIDVLFSLLFNK